MRLRGEARKIVQRIRARYDLATGPARIYLLHFDRAFGHAQHYLGFTGRQDVEQRFQEHRSGKGARLIRAARAVGIDFECAWVIAVPLNRARTVERALKNNGSSLRICPFCIEATRAQQLATKASRRAEVTQ